MLGEESPEAQLIKSSVAHLDREFKPTSLENDLCCNKPWRAWNGCATKFQRAGTFVRRPQAPVDVEDPEEEVGRLRAQVAELQHEREGRREAEESKAKKARVLSTPTLLFEGSSQCVFVADVGAGMVCGVGEASNPGPPKFLRRLCRGVSSTSEPASTVPASVRDIHVAHRVVFPQLWT